MHMRGRLTQQPKGGPFDKRVPNPSDTLGRSPTGEPARPKTTRLDTGLGAGADGVKSGTFSGAERTPVKIYTPTASAGGGSTALSQPTSAHHCAGGKLMGDTSKYGVLSPAEKNHDGRLMGGASRGREPEQWWQEAPSRRKPVTIDETNRALNQVAPGSQTRPQ